MRIGKGDDSLLLLVIPHLGNPGGDDHQVLHLLAGAALDRFVHESCRNYDTGYVHRIVDFLNAPVCFQAQDFPALGVNRIDLAAEPSGDDIVKDLIADFIGVPGRSDDGNGLRLK